MRTRVPAKNPEEQNSAVEVYLQLGPDSSAARALVDMLEQVRGAASGRTDRQTQAPCSLPSELSHGLLNDVVWWQTSRVWRVRR
jgi:hypothetical protein